MTLLILLKIILSNFGKIAFWLGAAFCLYGIEYNPFGIDKHPIIVAFVYSAVYGLSWAVVAALVMLLDVED